MAQHPRLFALDLAWIRVNTWYGRHREQCAACQTGDPCPVREEYQAARIRHGVRYQDVQRAVAHEEA